MYRAACVNLSVTGMLTRLLRPSVPRVTPAFRPRPRRGSPGHNKPDHWRSGLVSAGKTLAETANSSAYLEGRRELYRAALRMTAGKR